MVSFTVRGTYAVGSMEGGDAWECSDTIQSGASSRASRKNARVSAAIGSDHSSCIRLTPSSLK